LNEREEDEYSDDDDDEYDDDEEDDDYYDDDNETTWSTIDGDDHDDDDEDDDEADWVTIDGEGNVDGEGNELSDDEDEDEDEDEEIEINPTLLAPIEDVTHFLQEKGYTMIDLVSVLLSRPSRMDPEMDISYVAKINIELQKIFDTLDKSSFLSHMERNGIDVENIQFAV
jgi:hypothetical protein